MIYTIITLLIIGIALFTISFFINNRFDELEEQIEQLSISTLQDRYIMKNKIKVLEEELLTDQADFYSSIEKSDDSADVHQTVRQKESSIINRIEELHRNGYSPKDIEEMVGISEADIIDMIKDKF